MADIKLRAVIEAKDKASKVFKKFNSKLKDTRTEMGTFSKLVSAGIVVGIGKKAIDATEQYESRLGDLKTLIGDNKDEMDKFRKGILHTSKIIPKSPDELGASAYQIVSAGISDSSEALKVLESSGKLAVAGLGSTEEATNLLTSAMNTFGDSGLNSDQIANILFKTVKSGKTTVRELAGAFGATAPIVKEAGIKLDDFQAATAALTTTGLPAAQAQNALRGAVSALIKPTGEMQELFEILGVKSGPELISKSENLGDVFKKLKDAGDENNITMADAFGRIEGLNAVTGILGTTNESYIETLGDMQEGSDKLNTAFKDQTETFRAQKQLLKNELNEIMVTIGLQTMPMLTKAAKTFRENLQTKEIDDYVDSVNRLGDLQVRAIRKARELKRAGKTAQAERLLGIIKSQNQIRQKPSIMNRLFNNFGFPRYQEGGIVPGNRNEATPAILHGQETVLPAGISPVNITINNPSVRSDNDIRKIVQQIKQVLGRELEFNQLGAR